MTTLVRQQLMASTGALAAEHARLDQAKAQLEKEIEAMTALTPTGDDLVRALAEEIAAEEARTATKREALMRAEAALQTRARDAEEARERQRQEEWAAAVAGIHEAEARRLDAVDRFEQGMAMVAGAIVESFEAANEVRQHGRELLNMRGIERVTLHGLDQGEFTKRTAGRLAAVLAKRVVKGNTPRLGGLDWQNAAWTLFQEPNWADHEARMFASDINKLTGEH